MEMDPMPFGLCQIIRNQRLHQTLHMVGKALFLSKSLFPGLEFAGHSSRSCNSMSVASGKSFQGINEPDK